MSWRRRWVVLVPGEAAWVERRTREILEEEGDGSEHHFMIIQGQGRYQAIVEKGREEIGSEFLLGTQLSLECEDPVYAIEGVEEFPCVSRFLKGERSREEQEPEALVRSLGCVLPWFDEPPPKPLKRRTRTVLLVQGLSVTQVRNALAKKAGRSLPVGYYQLIEGPQGLLLKDGTGELTFQGIDLTYRFPLATIYSVIAKPDLDFFSVCVMRNRKIVEFRPAPQEATYHPAIHEVMGERTPERILAALGIPKEWFRL